MDTVNIEKEKVSLKDALEISDRFRGEAIKSIVGRAEVEGNDIKGELFLIEQQWNYPYIYKFLLKANINGKEILVEREVKSITGEFENELEKIKMQNSNLLNEYKDKWASKVLAYYAGKFLAVDLFKKLTGVDLPDGGIDKVLI